jgi:outer membrane protein assembly factor BamB
LKISISKTKISTIALVLLLSISGIISILPAVVAHDPAWSIPTWAYVSVSPRTVGVGEYTLIVFYLDKWPPTAGGEGGDRWQGHMIEITKPDGSMEQLGPFASGPVGSGWTTYTPTQVGEYTIVHKWPGQTHVRGIEPPNPNGIPYIGDYFEASTSEPTTLVVTSEPAEQWSEPPVTTGYWTRPINSANRNWAQLASNWLKGSWLVDDFQRWGKAPNTSHIMWTKPVISGGIPDASWGAQHGQTTDYENFFSDPIIMNGKIYWNWEMYPNYGYYCTDLQTGENIWYKNGTDNGLGQIVGDVRYQGAGGAGVYSGETYAQLSFGQMFHYYSLNGEGVMSHLWITSGSTWHMLEADSGNWVMSLVNVPGGQTITDQDGSIVRYTYDDDTGRFLGWNVTQAIGPPSPTGTGQAQWEPRQGHVIDAVNDTTWMEWGPRGENIPIEFIDMPRSGYTMNVTGPTGLPGGFTVLQDGNRVPKVFLSQPFGSYPRSGTVNLPQEFNMWAVEITTDGEYTPKPDQTYTQNWNLGYDVKLLWNKTIPYPLTNGETWFRGVASYEDDVWTLYCKETRQMWGYSLTTGNLLWGPTESEDAWNVYSRNQRVAYGNIYSYGYGGRLYCYDIKTGELKWTYVAEGIGYESPYGDYQLSHVGTVDGKIYMYSSEHSPTTPLWRGSYLRCIDAFTGEEIWKSLNFVSGAGIADGKIVAGNWYDQRMYCYGKGPSATTVTASPKITEWGRSVLIEGTVTDESAGAKQLIEDGKFTIVPAIADEHMDEWMDYVYMQQNCPTYYTGVEVKLETLDPNNNFYEIGTVTSDASGMYKLMWEPPVPGEYTIIATFTGSDSYGSSWAETAIGIEQSSLGQQMEPELMDSKPTTTEPATSEPAIPTGAPFITTEVVIIALVAVASIIGIAAFLLLRKRK